MNLSNFNSMSANSYRRLLTAHGRSTTPGLLEEPYSVNDAPKNVSKDTTKYAVKDVNNTSDTDVIKDGAKRQSPEKMLLKQAKDILAAEDAIKQSNFPPVSKCVNEEQAKHQPSGTYSFYKRPFRVRGKAAWECAMRDLGSINTLSNRYGYVEEKERREK